MKVVNRNITKWDLIEDTELIAKYLYSELSRDEKAQISEMIRNDPDLEKFYAFLLRRADTFSKQELLAFLQPDQKNDRFLRALEQTRTPSESRVIDHHAKVVDQLQRAKEKTKALTYAASATFLLSEVGKRIAFILTAKPGLLIDRVVWAIAFTNI